MKTIPNTVATLAMLTLTACGSTGAGTGGVMRISNDAPPSGNSYTMGNWNPNLYFQNFPKAQQCAAARQNNCSRLFNFAAQNATSDTQYFDVAVAHTSYYLDQGDIGNARRVVRSLETTVPGTSFAREFFAANPFPRSEGGFSIGKFFLVAGAVYLGTAVATEKFCRAVSGGRCDPSPSATNSGSKTSRTTSSTSRVAATKSKATGYKITSRSQYGPSQNVIARGICNSGGTFKVKFYPNNGNGALDHFIDGYGFGSSIDDVARGYCG